VRGSFSFNNNNLPIQSYHAFETVKEGGKLVVKQVGTPLTQHKDAYHAQCSMR
jgi:branched-chain amino acid transport system substrate-binding protein